MRYTKRIMALALACLIIFSLVPPVTVHAASNKAITFLTNNGILQGYGSGNLGLKDAITREQFVTFLYRVAGEPDVKGSTGFSDVKSSSAYYYKPVLWAKQQGITAGISATKFGVGSKVTCEQVVTFLYRFGNKIFGSTSTNMKKGAFPTGYTNYNSSGKCPEMRDALAWAYRHKLTDGTSDTMKKGTNACVRGDVAQLIYNFYKQFRKTYALVAETIDANSNGPAVNHLLVKEVLSQYADKTTVKDRTEKIDTYGDLKTAFKTAFDGATCIDLCYFYINSHGERGKDFVLGSPGNWKTWMTAEELVELTNSYPAKFVIMLEMCNSEQVVNTFRSNKSKADVICSAGTYQKAFANEVESTGLVPHPQRYPYLAGIATYCWSGALAKSSMPADKSGSMTVAPLINGKPCYLDLVSTSTGAELACQGNNDGFISIRELYYATWDTIDDITKMRTGGNQITYCYSPSNQPAYCAFGKLD